MAGREDVFQRAMNRGHSSAWDQNWNQAVEYYRQALRENPEHPGALASLGLAFFELQRFSDALQCYSQAASLSPEDPMPVERIARIYELTGHPQRAVKAALRAADLYLKRGEGEKVIETLARVTRLEAGNLAARSRLALVYERLARREQAAAEYLAIASLFQERGEIEKAIQAVNRALLIAPQSSEARHALALLRASRPLPRPEQPGAATPPLAPPLETSEAPELAPAPSPGQDLIDEAREKATAALAGLLLEHSVGEAELLPDSEQVGPSSMAYHLGQAVELQTFGRDSLAADELERAIQAGLDHPAASFVLGQLRSRGDALESARMHLERASRHPDYALAARLLLGQVLWKMGLIDEAALEYLEALRIGDSRVVPPHQSQEIWQLYDPLIRSEAGRSDPKAKARLFDTIADLLLREDWKERLLQARRSLPVDEEGGPLIPLGEMLTEARSSQVVGSMAAIRQLARQGYLRSAMEEAFWALQFAPTYLPLHITMGELLLKQNHLVEAVEKFNVAAHDCSARGERGRAIELLRRVIQIAPMDVSARSHLIEELRESGQYEAAVGEFLGLAEVYYDLADLERARKVYEEAFRLAQKAGLSAELQASILYEMADTDLQSLDWRQALRVYGQICELQPDDPRARTSLVQLHLRLGYPSQALAEMESYLARLLESGGIERAIAFLEGLLEENPEQAAMRRRLAELYRQAGRTAEAISQYDRLGEALLDAGDPRGAAEAVEAILALDPPKREEYRALLARLRAGA